MINWKVSLVLIHCLPWSIITTIWQRRIHKTGSTRDSPQCFLDPVYTFIVSCSLGESYVRTLPVKGTKINSQDLVLILYSLYIYEMRLHYSVLLDFTFLPLFLLANLFGKSSGWSGDWADRYIHPFHFPLSRADCWLLHSAGIYISLTQLLEYIDTLLQDKSHRKGWFRDLFSRYWARDFAGLGAESMESYGYGVMA